MSTHAAEGTEMATAADTAMKAAAADMETEKDAAADMETEKDAAADTVREKAMSAAEGTDMTTVKGTVAAADTARAIAIKTNSPGHVAFTGIHIGRPPRPV